MRYMDAQNEKEISKEALLLGKCGFIHWRTNMQLDIYCIRFWNKFLKDKGLHQQQKPFKTD
jgi:hypothetical protein